MFSEHERQGAQHELGEKHEYYQAEILKITERVKIPFPLLITQEISIRISRFSKSFLIILTLILFTNRKRTSIERERNTLYSV